MRLILALILAAVYEGSVWGATPGCDCTTLTAFCGVQSEDSISHISRRHPNCSLEELKACGMGYELRVKTNLKKANNAPTVLFMDTIAKEAPTIMEIYKGRVTPREYTELAALAFGIVGNESNYFGGFWYRVKQYVPEYMLRKWKCHRRGKEKCKADFSYGPTQMKPDSIPDLIADKYKVSKETLYARPEHAAVATMGALIEWKENLYHLKKSYNSMSGVDSTTYVDYIPYFYQGKGARPLYKMEMPNAADPGRNGYLFSIREYRDSLRVIEYSCPNGRITNSLGETIEPEASR